MMNATHGPSGTLAGLWLWLMALWLRLLTPAACLTDPVVGLFWIAGSTAGALLPDADHHSSNTARLWGPLTRVPCYFLGRLAGGHREGTHDVSRGAPILFGLFFAAGLAAPAAYHAAGGPVWLGLVARFSGMTVVALLAGLAILGLAAFIPGDWEGEGLSNLGASWSIALAASWLWPRGLPWLCVAAAVGGIVVGVVVGISGDGCTISGVPWRGRDVHLLPRGLRIRTGSGAEVLLVRFPVLAGICALSYLLAAELGVPGLGEFLTAVR